MRRTRVAAEWRTARFGTTNAGSATETPPLLLLDTKSLPMTAVMPSSSEFPYISKQGSPRSGQGPARARQEFWLPIRSRGTRAYWHRFCNPVSSLLFYHSCSRQHRCRDITLNSKSNRHEPEALPSLSADLRPDTNPAPEAPERASRRQGRPLCQARGLQ